MTENTPNHLLHTFTNERFKSITSNTIGMQLTKITPKYQTTIPKEIRNIIGVTKGKEVEWHVIKNMIVVDSAKKIKNPVQFLTTQTKLHLDMVKLVHEARED